MSLHLLFYDADCALCRKAIREIFKADEKQLFVFAPLNGETAREILIGPNAHFAKEDSLILLENYRSDARRFWLRSKGAFRVYWLLGSYWIGWLCFLPAWVGDWAYRLVAEHRHRLRVGLDYPELKGDRFLP